jgi:RNA polymerase sigma-70 factor (ECF subfamily)
MSPGGLRECSGGSGSFPSTHWSAIRIAGQDACAKGDAALAELCLKYWYPIYAFARRKNFQPADAQDLTQAFFAHLIETHLVHKADPDKGRFRSFLLGCFQVFVASEFAHAQTQKRGGGVFTVPLDLHEAELRFLHEPHATASPEKLFDRHWAVATLDATLTRLESEMRQSGRADLFQQLLPGLQGDDSGPRYAELARRLGTTEATIRVTINRLRFRYREILRSVVAETLNDPLDVESELAHLMAALRD